MSTTDAVLLPRIELRIQSIRGLRVIVDVDLAVLYGIETKRLNEQVRRNRQRFPSDFLFQLTLQEKAKVGATETSAGCFARVDGATAHANTV